MDDERRALLKTLGLGLVTASASISGCAHLLKPPGPAKDVGGDHSIDFNPIDRTLGDVAPRIFSGDDPEATHQILWDKAGYLASHGGRIPPPAESVPLVIVGGGMSGLATAYLLRKYNPVVLERAARFGGNSRGESWSGADYSIGAAYFVKPEPDSPIGSLLGELGVSTRWRSVDSEDPIEWRGRLYRNFWQGETDPPHAAQFKKIARHFADVYDGKGGRVYPDIPVTDSRLRAAVNHLDRLTFRQHLEKVAGRPLHPHIETAMEHYCWSSFAAGFGEISAAAGLNFYAGERAGLVVLPGGNAAVAETFMQRLLDSLPRANLRNDSIVFDVRADAEGATVAYRDPRGEIRAIRARAVVLACPKFAVKRILHEIEPARAEAIGRLRYNAYLVANVLLRGPVKEKFYDLFMIGEGKTDRNDIVGSTQRQKVTDVVLGTYANANAKMDAHTDANGTSGKSILTLYRALPFDAGRPMVYAADAYSKFRYEFEEQIQKNILPLVGTSAKDMIDLRIARWGHPLPVAAAGLIADQTVDAIQKPFRERVFFVEQDNWMLPALETALSEALTWSPRVAKFL